MKTYEGIIEKLQPNQIFVFGSNTEGRHGAGAAATAFRLFGAKYGQARGPQGKSYAIVTKDLTKDKHPSVSESEIKQQIKDLYFYAQKHPTLEFLIAYSGSGKNLNYYTPEQMAEMFSCTTIPNNIVFEKEFAKLVKKNLVGGLTQPKSRV